MANKVANGALDHDTTRAALLNIIRERDQLRSEVALARAAIIEFENQTIQLDRLLYEAHATIQKGSNAKQLVRGRPSEFIGAWQSTTDYPILRPIERLWKTGHLQQALTKMPSLIHRKDIDNRHKVAIRLLNTALLHSSGTNFRMALRHAEEALEIAHGARLYELAGKAQFWRGLCFLSLDEYVCAHMSFVLASNLSDHNSMITDLKLQVEKELGKLPRSHPGRAVSKDFKFFCDPSMERFVCGSP